MKAGTASRERPILFSGEMVRAILDGRKTQTRRVVRWKPRHKGLNLGFSGLTVGYYSTFDPTSGWVLRSRDGMGLWNDRTYPLDCPYGQPGDRLYVRETFVIESSFGIEFDYEPPFEGRPLLRHHNSDWGDWWEQPHYRATDPKPDLVYENMDEPACRWRPSIHMPKWASRLWLEVTGIRVERVQEISAADAVAEGIHGVMEDRTRYFGPPDENGRTKYPTPGAAFHSLWDSLNAKRGYSWESNPWVWVVEFASLTAQEET